MYPEPMETTIDSILIYGVEHTCSHPQPPLVGGQSGHGGRGGQRRVAIKGSVSGTEIANTEL